MSAQSPHPPTNEAARLEALHAYEVLDTPPQPELDELTKLASEICDAPMALVSLVDEHRQWFKAKVGLEAQETPRDISFCTHGLDAPGIFLVPNAETDSRFANNPLVTGEEGVRFYAGAPLRTPEGHTLGMLCVMDREPRELTAQQRQSLEALGRQVMLQLDLERRTRVLQKSEAQLLAWEAELRASDQPVAKAVDPLAASSALQASEDRLHSVIEHLNEGLVICRENFGLVHWNPAALAMHGFRDNAEWCRLLPDFKEIFELSDLDGRVLPFEEWPVPRLMRGERLFDVELRIRRLDIEWERIFRYNGTVVPQSNGEKLTFLTMSDITQRRRAEQRLRDSLADRRRAQEALENSRRFLSDLIEHSGSLIFVKDKDGRYELVNKHWEEVTGIDRAQVIGHTDEEFFCGPDAAKFREMDLAIMRSGKSRTVEERLTDHGRVRDFLSVKFPLKNAEGEVTGLCGMATEITDRKAVEEKLRQQAALLDKAQDAILVRDLNHRITYWNKSAERLYGWTAEEAMGKSVEELIYDDAAPLHRATAVTLDRGEWVGEIEQLTKEGRVLTVEGHWTLVRDEAGLPKSILSINTDLTERKKLETQFLRAQRMESIGTLAGGIAHDLNNVLAPILLSLGLLKMKFTDDDSQEILGMIKSSAERGADMVRQVLSFARGVEGERLPVQLSTVVKDIEKITNETFLKHVQVQSRIAPDLWTVIGDPTQLHQVLLNLCVNARDAMPDGGALNITAENEILDTHYSGLNLEAVPGPYVALTVEDTGSGIPPEVLDKIFDPFFTTKEVGKGTGLGLSTTMAIIKGHGGFIRVYSELGRGTRFKVFLPASPQATAKAAAVANQEAPRGDGECILLVDDELTVRKVTQQTLQAFGYRVLVAADGAEALAMFAPRTHDIALVLTDMMMPVMDGPSLIQVLWKMKPSLPVIGASGLSANGHVARATNLGVKHFLPKPYTAEVLLKVLRIALDEAKAAGAK